MKKRFLSVLGMAMSAVMLFSACGGSGTSSNTGGSTSEPTNKAVVTTSGGGAEATGTTDKDTLVFVMNAEPTSMEPGATSTGDSYPRMTNIQIYETLLRQKMGDKTTLEPLLCDSYEFSEDGLHINFAIKQGVKFHNGDEMTVDDVAYSINKALAMPNVQELADMIEDAEVIDDTHVQVNLKYAYSPVLNILVNPAFSIISQKYYEQCQADGTNFGRNPMGTGAYKFVSWQNGANIKLAANENWHKGDVAIKNVEFRFMADATTAAIALESGDSDIFYGVDSADLPRLRENPDINVLSVQSAGFYFIALNTDGPNEALKNDKVRKAINMAVNRQEIIDGGQDGVGWVTECPITPGIFGYQEDFHADPYDVEAAKALLAEAGYPDGLTIQMKTPESSYYSRPAQVIQEELRQIGITVDLQVMERGAFNTDVGNRDYESIYFWIGSSFPDADNIVYKLFHSQFAHSGLATNMACINSPEADELVEKGRQELDPDARMEIYKQLSELNNENAWYIPILTSTNTLCARNYVNNAYGDSAAYYYIADWSFNRE